MRNRDIPELRDYEASEDDQRPIADPELELQADKIGKIHSRKGKSKTEFLEGYGTTDFGVSAYEESHALRDSLIFGSGLAATGIFAWKFRDEIVSGFETLTNYALLIREAMRETAREE